MQINPYIPFESKRHIFLKPFSYGLPNLKIAFDKTDSLSLGERVKYLVIGVALLIPLVNIIVYLALKRFSKAPENPQESPINVMGKVKFDEIIRIREFNKDKPAEEIGKSSITKKIDSTLKPRVVRRHKKSWSTGSYFG